MSKSNSQEEVFVHLSTLLHDQHTVLEALEAAEQFISPQDQGPNKIRNLVRNSGEAAAFRQDNVSSSEFESMLLSHWDTRGRILKTLESAITTKQRSKKYLELRECELEFNREVISRTTNPEPYIHLLFKVRESQIRPKSAPVIYQSLFITACANFESFLKEFITTTLNANPVILNSRQETFDWKKISRRGEVQKIKRELIEKQVSELLRQSMSEWLKWFESRIRLSISKDLRESCITFYKVRNMFGHEQSSGMMRIDIVSGEWVRRAIDTYLTLASELCCASEMTFTNSKSRDSETLRNAVQEIIYELIVQERYTIAMTIGESMVSLLPEDSHEVIVNQFIAKKKHLQSAKSSLSEFFSEVQAWDTSQLKPIFQLAKLALLNQTRSARKLALRLSTEEVISEVEWLTWPLFDDIRGRVVLGKRR